MWKKLCLLKQVNLYCRDKTVSAISCQYYMPMLKERVQMFIKYCEPCQRNNTQKLDKCPHEMKPIKVPNEVMAQIGKWYFYHFH